MAAWLLILSAWGCQSTPQPVPEPGEPRDASPATPQALLSEADAASGARASRLYLRAAEALLEAGRITDATDALDRVQPERLRERETARFLLARATVHIHRGDMAAAQAALAALDKQLLTDPFAAELLRARVIAARQGAAAAATRLMAARLDDADAAQVQRRNDAIWQYLGDVPALEVANLATAPGSEARGWWELKTHMLQSLTLAAQRRRLEAWRSAWPRHPAAALPPAGLAALGTPISEVRQVGLMLPLSGPLSRAGRAVRDAFFATYLSNSGDVGYQVRVYDTAAEPIPALYERALLDGADVLVGPLQKEAVTAMNDLDPEVPVLALNYLGDALPAPNLVQLGLAIEDEARTLEQWINDAGLERLVLLHNNQDWSQRALAAFQSDWTGPLVIQPLEDIRTITESVGVAMHVAASEERRAALQDVIRENVEFLPRARGDVDAVLALVTPVEATALVPALKFHFADHLPVYATSQTVRGASPERLTPLAGFRVSELPWFVVADGAYRELNSAFELTGSPFVSLYALGVDAFRLADRLPLILGGNLSELLGSTGELRFPPDGRIERRLARTVVRRGSLVQAPGTTSASGR